MSTLNSETNESNRFMYKFTDKLNLKNPNKIMALTNLSIYGKTLNLNTATTNLKFLLQLGMMNLICLVGLILFLIFEIILNTSSKNMKLLQIILLYKFMLIKQKAGLCLK